MTLFTVGVNELSGHSGLIRKTFLHPRGLKVSFVVPFFSPCVFCPWGELKLDAPSGSVVMFSIFHQSTVIRLAPVYLTDLLHPYTSSQALRSAGQSWL